MKIRDLYITTNYPRGYNAEDPRLITGRITLTVGPNSYDTITHKLSPKALRKIGDVAYADFLEAAKECEAGPSTFFDEADLPSAPEPEAEPTVLSIATDEVSNDPF